MAKDNHFVVRNSDTDPRLDSSVSESGAKSHDNKQKETIKHQKITDNTETIRTESTAKEDVGSASKRVKVNGTSKDAKVTDQKFKKKLNTRQKKMLGQVDGISESKVSTKSEHAKINLNTNEKSKNKKNNFRAINSSKEKIKKPDNFSGASKAGSIRSNRVFLKAGTGAKGAAAKVSAGTKSGLSQAVPIIISAIVAVCGVAGVSDLSSTVAFSPSVGEYYMDTTTPTDDEFETIRNYVNSNYPYTKSYKDNEKKILIAQKAVDEMSKEKNKFGKAQSENATCVQVLLDGANISTASVGSDYTKFTAAHTYIGVPLKGSKSKAKEETKPSFEVPSESDRGTEKIYIKYVNESTAKSVGYYPEAKNTKQYLGNTNFKKTGFKIAGWSLTKDSDQIDFKLYEELTSETFSRLKSIEETSGTTVVLYPVWVSDSMSIRTEQIGVVTQKEIEEKYKDYFTEDDLTVRYAYLDAEGNVSYTLDTERTTGSYSKNEVYKAILAMATVATDNDKDNPDTYIEYCKSLLGLALHSTNSYSLEFTTKEMEDSYLTDDAYTWKEDGVTYFANSARLTCALTVYIDPSVEYLMANDKTIGTDLNKDYLFAGWDESSKEEVRNILSKSDADFKLMYNVVFPATNIYMSGNTSEAKLFNILIKKGYSVSSAIGILANLQYETHFKETYEYLEDGVLYIGMIKAEADKLKEYAKDYSEEWATGSGGISIETQADFLADRAESAEWYSTFESSRGPGGYLGAYEKSYVFMSLNSFKELTDSDRAAVAFRASYLHEDYDEGAISVILSYIEELSARVVYGTQGGDTSSYTELAIQIAEDDSHGYSNALDSRNGPDYDCASFVAYCIISTGFLDGNPTSLPGPATLYEALEASDDWEQIPYTKGLSPDENGLMAGDILFVDPMQQRGKDHVEIYLGDNQLVGAHQNYGYPQTGDQNGEEISVTGWYDDEWEYAFRLKAGVQSREDKSKGILVSNNHVSYFDTTMIGEVVESIDGVYGSRYQTGFAVTADPSIQPGTVIRVETNATGDCSNANNRYFLVVSNKTTGNGKVQNDYNIYLYKNMQGDTAVAPYGSLSGCKVYVVEQGVSLQRFQREYR